MAVSVMGPFGLFGPLWIVRAFDAFGNGADVQIVEDVRIVHEADVRTANRTMWVGEGSRTTRRKQNLLHQGRRSRHRASGASLRIANHRSEQVRDRLYRRHSEWSHALRDDVVTVSLCTIPVAPTDPEAVRSSSPNGSVSRSVSLSSVFPCEPCEYRQQLPRLPRQPRRPQPLSVYASVRRAR